MRTVARTQAVALGLGACELCELVSASATSSADSDSVTPLQQFQNGTLADKQILFRETITVKYQKKSLQVNVLVLYQPDYCGGAGLEHGSLFGEIPSKLYRGKVLIVLGTADTSVSDMLQVLGLPAQLVALKTTQHEAVSVQALLYRAASQILTKIEPAIRAYNASAIHVVGHSLAGGIATILSTILEGHLAPAPPQTGKRKKKGHSPKADHNNSTTTESAPTNATVTTNTTVGSGWGRGRTSAVVLGAPPSVSANVPTDTLVTSIIYGDDWVSRTTDASLQRLIARVQPILKRRKSVLTKQAALFTDTVKLATQGLTAHAHGREGEECRLTSTTGSKAYLLRPRRYENHVSIHEMGRSSGREAIRAAVLWQLSDILLSPSYAKHHSLHSYIDGLDRVHVRGLDDGRNAGDDERDGLEEWEDQGGQNAEGADQSIEEEREDVSEDAEIEVDEQSEEEEEGDPQAA